MNRQIWWNNPEELHEAKEVEMMVPYRVKNGKLRAAFPTPCLRCD
jgi:hypothetical protein